MRGKRHNTLPNIYGPWPPSSEKPEQHNLYCASVLALTKPWRQLSDIKDTRVTWATELQNWLDNAPIYVRDVVAGIQYYYDAKSAGEAAHENKMMFDIWEQTEDIGQPLGDNVDMGNVSEQGVALTEEDLERYEAEQVSVREEAHGQVAVLIGLEHSVFAEKERRTEHDAVGVHIANGGDLALLGNWQQSMADNVFNVSTGMESEGTYEDGNIAALSTMEVNDDAGEVVQLAFPTTFHKALEAVPEMELLEDQRCAFDIIPWHLMETKAGRVPPPLRMVIPGEGGVGKSKTIQTITEDFHKQGLAQILVKGAYTGVAASVIDGKTFHVLSMIPLNSHQQSANTLKKLTTFWQSKEYLIIDEISMVSRDFFAKLSKIISCTRTTMERSDLANQPFGGMNVILVGGFHQFPPVASKTSAPLFFPCDPLKDMTDEILGRKIYEQFTVVIRLKTQVHIIDPKWLDLLQHVRHGNCKERHIVLLHSLILGDPHCPPSDFTTEPWNQAVLITPRHAVQIKWNAMMARSQCNLKGEIQSDSADTNSPDLTGIQLFICPCIDTIGGQQLTLEERFMVVMKHKGRCSGNPRERASLSKEIELAVGMEVMVTFNVLTDIDVANGARGEVVEIVLDDKEDCYSPNERYVHLHYPPAYVLVWMKRTKAEALEGLEEGVLPIVPLTKTFNI